MTARVVSRSAELEAVAELLACAQAEPAGLIFEGEPGIGKTTVWSAALKEARQQGFLVLSTRPAAAESVLAYASLADMLSDVDAAGWADLPSPQRLAIDRVMLRAAPDAAATDPRAVATGFGSVISRLAAHRPVLLAVDDMHWLDSASAAALTFAVRRLSGPVAVLGATRVDPSGTGSAPRVKLDGPTPARRIRLCPLDLAGTRAAVAQCLNRSFARPTMVRIHEISGGNPFYAMELARAVSEEPSRVEIPLPTTLSDLVRARISGLDPDVCAALLASASASSPTVELVARAVGDTAEHVADLLESTTGIIAIHGAALRFTHPLLAWGVYADADPAARRTMHRRLAEMVDEPELRARHLALAATGQDEQTVAALDEAAALARIRGAPTAAAELTELAIALGADTPERRILLAASLFTAGDSSAARAQLQAVVAGQALGKQRAEALTQLAVLSLSDGSWTEAADLLTAALDEVGDDHQQRARVLVPLSLAQLNSGQLEASARTIGDALAAEPEPTQQRGQALSMRVIIDFMAGDGFDGQTQAMALALEERDPPVWVQLRPTVHDASLRAWTGDLDEAHHRFLALRHDLIERGQESELMFVAFLTVLTEIWRADFATARSVIDDALERAMHLDGWLPLGVAQMLRALLDAYTGREHDTRRHLDAAAGAIERSGSNYLTTWLAAGSGFLEVSLGNHEAALRILEPALTRFMACPRGTEIFAAGFLPDAIEAMVHTGRLDAAEVAIAALDDNGRRLDRAWMLAMGARCRAMLLAARGDVDGAAAAVEHALAEHQRLPMPFERARTLLLAGQIQRRRRIKDASAVTLREALDVFTELGTPLWVDRARFELSRVKAGVHPAAELTTSERRVADLLASGMTRREAGAALFISPKTVEATLARVYRKLGIHSRAELGRYMAELNS